MVDRKANYCASKAEIYGNIYYRIFGKIAHANFAISVMFPLNC